MKNIRERLKKLAHSICEDLERELDIPTNRAEQIIFTALCRFFQI